MANCYKLKCGGINKKEKVFSQYIKLKLNLYNINKYKADLEKEFHIINNLFCNIFIKINIFKPNKINIC